MDRHALPARLLERVTVAQKVEKLVAGQAGAARDEVEAGEWSFSRAGLDTGCRSPHGTTDVGVGTAGNILLVRRRGCRSQRVSFHAAARTEFVGRRHALAPTSSRPIVTVV